MLCSTHKWRRCADSVMRNTIPERIRVWRELCETHELGSEAEYEVDGAGLVFGRE